MGDTMLQPKGAKYFAEVARTGSLRHAAETFDIAPSAISRQITQLEQELGTVLFERSTRGMILTEGGVVLLEYIKESEARLEQVQIRLDDLTQLRRGTVRIATVEAVTNKFLPSALVSFHEKYSGISFEVTVCGTRDVAERVATNASEVGLAFNPPSRHDLVLRARIPQPLQLICAPGHHFDAGGVLSMKQLDGAAVALPARNFGIRRLVDEAAESAGIRLDVVLEADSLQLIKNVVSSSNLVSFMPPLTFAQELAGGTLAAVELDGKVFSRASIDVLTAQGHEPSQAARHFLSFMKDMARPGAN
jgi:DNA-binding transcriptional LysR family regulator